jgi:TolB-like protein/Tfp pilus assembly protein PilF
MATVHLAVQESLGREVALKLLAPELANDPSAAERFIREARIAAQLEHRHIVGVHDVGSHDGRPFLSMEYMAGDRIGAGALPPEEALRVVREIALALDHAHRQGVIHRDVKPENILRRADASFALSDFGIARTTEAGRLTAEGMTVGTPHYMSPEQVQGQALDGRADLYSLGVVLYQLLTGELPYRGTDGWNIGMQHISAPVPTLPPPLQRYQPLLDAAMAKDPAQRPQSGEEFARLVQALQTTSAVTPTQVLPGQATPGGQRPRRWWPAALASVAVIALALVAWQLRRPTPTQSPTVAAHPPVGVPAVPGLARTIAVMPLASTGASAGEFSDGLAETLLDMLAHAPGQTVISRASSFAFKGKGMDAKAIGAALGATHLLEGSVQESSGRLRITLRLVRAVDGKPAWSQRYERDAADVFAVQDDVARDVVNALAPSTPAPGTVAAQRGGTTSLDAYREYLRGNAQLALRRVADLRIALAHFERALELDPKFASAHAMAANALTMIGARAPLSPAQLRRRDGLVRRALALDPKLGEAYIARATILWDSDVAAAERDFRKGIALAPNFTAGYSTYAVWLAGHEGRVADAIPITERAIRIDPLDNTLRVNLGFLLLSLGRVEQAAAIGEQAYRAEPDLPYALKLRAAIYRTHGDLPGELRTIDRLVALDPADVRARTTRCEALLSAGAYAWTRRCDRALRRFDADVATRAEAGLDMVEAYVRRDTPGIRAALDRAQDPSPTWRATLARLEGHPAEAVEILRVAMPAWFTNPIGKPNTDREYNFLDAAAALIASGNQTQADRVLDYGMRKVVLTREPGSTFGGRRGWTDVMAYAFQGKLDKACAAMDASIATGYYQLAEDLQGEPLLAPLRAQPCFAPAYARIRALAAAQVTAAEKAGLL